MGETQKQIFWQFLCVVLLAQIALIVLALIFPRLGSMSGVSFIIPFIGANFTAGQFLRKAKRLPTDDEKSSAVKLQFLTWIGFSIVLGIIPVSLIFLEDSFSISPTFMAFLAIVLLVVFLLQLLMMRYAWGRQIRTMAKKQGLSANVES